MCSAILSTTRHTDAAMSPTAIGGELPQWCGKTEGCPQALLGWLYLTHDQNDQVKYIFYFKQLYIYNLLFYL